MPRSCATPSPEAIATDAPLRVGSKELGKPFVGQIDDLRLYSRVLTPEQVEDLAIHHPMRVILSGVTGKPSKEEAGQNPRVFPHLRRARVASDDVSRAEGAARAEGRSRQAHPHDDGDERDEEPARDVHPRARGLSQSHGQGAARRAGDASAAAEGRAAQSADAGEVAGRSRTIP